MINKIIEILTKKKVDMDCGFCKEKFVGKKWKNYFKGFGFISVVDGYCSKKCERLMDKAIKKCFNNKKLTKLERSAVKDLCYVDV